MHVWKKDERIKLSKNFISYEFSCKCNYISCQNQFISSKLVNILQKIREEFGEALIITSAYRCRQHQDAIRGNGIKTAKSTSTHELGVAVDIAPIDITPEKMDKLLKICEKYIQAIGISNNFLHLDLRLGKKRRWNY